MLNFDAEEHLTENGAVLVITAKNGLTFDDGSTTKEVTLVGDYGPHIGERIMCGKTLVKVARKRFDDAHVTWVLDEDTKVWFRWEPQDDER